LNLMLNAFDAIGNDGELTIRIADDGAGFASLSVADTGAGISQAVRDRLFEPFVSTKESGSGLGLTTCRRIVEDHGGRIEAADGSGRGAIFTVKLPMSACSPPADELPLTDTLPNRGPAHADALGR
jgi:signal transduction histidine kinase